MELNDRKLRHDIRGGFQNLLFSVEVLRGNLSDADLIMFLEQLISGCQKVDGLMAQLPAVPEET